MPNDWIHTRRGVQLVEGTLPRLCREIAALAEELQDIRTAHPYVGLEATAYTGAALQTTGVVVAVLNENQVTLLLDDGSHLCCGLHQITLDDPGEAVRRLQGTASR